MLVSIAMPTFGQHEYIKESINSILSQTYKNIELIIIPVAGDDETIKIIKSIKDRRIRVVISNYANITHQMNLGAYSAKSKWFMYFASDDYLYPGSVKNMLRFSEKNNTVVTYPDYDIGKVKGDNRFHVMRKKNSPEFDPKFSMDKSSYITDVSMVDRKEFLKYLPMKCTDGKYRIKNVWQKIIQNIEYHKRIKRFPYATFIYRQHKTSVHKHGSQNNFRAIQLDSNILSDISIRLPVVKRINLSSKDYAIYINNIEIFIRYNTEFLFKKIVLHWLDDKYIHSIDSKMDRVYNITCCNDIFSKLSSKTRFARKIFKKDIERYIVEDNKQDIILESRSCKNG